MWRRVALGLATVALAAPGWTGELAGVTLPDTAKVGDATLQLNGLGLRKKAVFKVYVGALYLAQKSSDPAAILAADTPKRMVMHFLRDVDAEAISGAWREGIEANSPAALPAVKDRLDQFCGWWLPMATGKQAVMTYVPGKGTDLAIDGKELGVVPGKDFADALFGVWLGSAPPSADLKKGVLGIK